MTNCWTYCEKKPGSDFYGEAINVAKCLNTPIRSISQSDVISYAKRAGATDAQMCATALMLLVGRLVYWKNTPGDCPLKSSISLGLPGIAGKATGLAGAGLGAASAVGLAATGGAGVGASAGGAGAAFGGLPASFAAAGTIIGLAAIPLAVWGIISAHHKIAVAREQATLCDFSQAYNTWEDQMEQGIAAGIVSVSDAKIAVPIIESQLVAGLQKIRQECNAACYMQKFLRALNLYAVEVVYDSLSPRGTSAAPQNVYAGKNISSNPSANLGSGGRVGIAAIGGVAAALLT